MRQRVLPLSCYCWNGDSHPEMRYTSLRPKPHIWNCRVNRLTKNCIFDDDIKLLTQPPWVTRCREFLVCEMINCPYCLLWMKCDLMLLAAIIILIDNDDTKLFEVMKLIHLIWVLNFLLCSNHKLNCSNILITFPFLKIQSNYLNVK